MIIYLFCPLLFFFFFKQKTAYEMRISDWSSDVCSSDLSIPPSRSASPRNASLEMAFSCGRSSSGASMPTTRTRPLGKSIVSPSMIPGLGEDNLVFETSTSRSEEHTSELQSLMRISYAVFCLKKKTITKVYRDALQINPNKIKKS